MLPYQHKVIYHGIYNIRNLNFFGKQLRLLPYQHTPINQIAQSKLLQSRNFNCQNQGKRSTERTAAQIMGFDFNPRPSIPHISLPWEAWSTAHDRTGAISLTFVKPGEIVVCLRSQELIPTFHAPCNIVLFHRRSVMPWWFGGRNLYPSSQVSRSCSYASPVALASPPAPRSSGLLLHIVRNPIKYFYLRVLNTSS